MSVRDVVAAIADLLGAAGVTATVLIGRMHLAERPELIPYDGTFLRVVFVPTAMQYGPPGEIGGQAPRLANRKQTLEVHVAARAPSQADPTEQHERDLEITEALADQVVAALMKLPYTVADWGELGSGSFGAKDPTTVVFGASCMFSVTVDIPVRDAPFTVVADADPIVQGAIHDDQTDTDVDFL